MPEQFWRLTVREFWMKHDAFVRAEGRAESAWIRNALRTKQYKAPVRSQMQQQANRLKRYPLKPWLMGEDT